MVPGTLSTMGTPGPTTRPAHLYFRITKDGNLVVAISPHALAFWGRGRKRIAD